MFTSILLHLHSILRWVMLVLLLFTIIRFFINQQKELTKVDRKFTLYSMITSDIMLLLGGFLWFFGDWGLHAITTHGMASVMKNSVMRFFCVEHPLLMIIAIVLIHLGNSSLNHSISDAKKKKRVAIFYLIALVLILFAIPWSFREMFFNRGWF